MKYAQRICKKNNIQDIPNRKFGIDDTNGTKTMFYTYLTSISDVKNLSFSDRIDLASHYYCGILVNIDNGYAKNNIDIFIGETRGKLSALFYDNTHKRAYNEIQYEVIIASLLQTVDTRSLKYISDILSVSYLDLMNLYEYDN